MSNNNWISDRPPTEEEVPDGDVVICTLRSGHVDCWGGEVVRTYWCGGKNSDPIAWMMPPEPFVPEVTDAFDSQDFYELMQAYLWCGRVPVVDHQPDVEKAFQDVIAFIREQVAESKAAAMECDELIARIAELERTVEERERQVNLLMNDAVVDSADTPDLYKGWRLLEPGQIIQLGDEWLNMKGEWVRTSMVGFPVSADGCVSAIYRRRVEEPKLQRWEGL